MTDLILCLVKENRAYFTSVPLENQWGDDWNDSPYEHNAGSPYKQDKQGNPVEIVEVIFDSDFISPCTGLDNSSYSVEKINSGVVPWLRSPDYLRHVDIRIFAGCTLDLFIQYIKMSGGKIFMEVK